MLISEIGVYEFLKDKLKFLDSDAKKYAKEMAFAEKRLRADIKDCVAAEIKFRDFATKQDIHELAVATKRDIHELAVATKQNIHELAVATKQDIHELAIATKKDISSLEIKMERGFKNIIIWIIGFTSMVIGGFITLAKLLSH